MLHKTLAHQKLPCNIRMFLLLIVYKTLQHKFPTANQVSLWKQEGKANRQKNQHSSISQSKISSGVGH